MSDTISVNIAAKSPSYLIKFGANLLTCSTWLPKAAFNRVVIITDDFVKEQYGVALSKHLKKSGHDTLLLSFPPGEKFKNNTTKQKIENEMLLQRCDRDTLVLALGGGVVGDVAGYIAATFLRGVPYFQIPTTLLAMIDSSVGGKTGINTIHGKNLIGAIYQPLGVVIDVSLLKTLSTTHMINGLMEAIKIFLTHDEKSFFYTQSNLNDIIKGEEPLLKEIVRRAVKIKAGVVVRDEKEQGERGVLNFGHTIGHALEKISNYKLLHGYAVAYGILVEATISHHLGFLKLQHLITIKKLMTALSVHGSDLKKYDLTKILSATKNDKKSRFNKVYYVLLKEIGCVYVSKKQYVHPVSDSVVRQAFKQVIAEVKNVG